MVIITPRVARQQRLRGIGLVQRGGRAGVVDRAEDNDAACGREHQPRIQALLDITRHVSHLAMEPPAEPLLEESQLGLRLGRRNTAQVEAEVACASLHVVCREHATTVKARAGFKQGSGGSCKVQEVRVQVH